MMKTIREIAKEIGVDKQKVYRYIKSNRIKEAHQKNGVMYYDDAAETTIKQGFSEKQPHQVSASNDAVVDVLLKQAEMLQRELEIKNKQIEELNQRLAESQKLLDQQQQLNAIAEQKMLQIEAKQNEEEPPKKRWKLWK